MRFIAIAAAVFTLIPTLASAQLTGHDVALFSSSRAIKGQDYHLVGVLYQVRGLADLRAGSGEFEVALVARGERGARTVVHTQQVRAGADGRFEADVPIPGRELRAPQLELMLPVPNEDARKVSFRLSIAPDRNADLRTDRARYEPGETVRIWLRSTRTTDGAPDSQTPVEIRVIDPSGQVVSITEDVPTSEGGVVTHDVALGPSAREGTYRVVATLPDLGRNASFEVSRRTINTMLLDAKLVNDVVRPGQPVDVFVSLTNPSGGPVRGGRVDLHLGDTNVAGITNREGQVTLRLRAPAILPSDPFSVPIRVVATHSAYGTITRSVFQRVSRSRFTVEVAAEGGALVPEIEGYVYLSVLGLDGTPAPSGTELKVRGLASGGREIAATVGEDGVARVAFQVEADDVAGGAGSQGPCQGRVGAELSVAIGAEGLDVTDVCVPVAREAELMVRANRVVVGPSDRLVVAISRASAVRGRPVLLRLRSKGVIIDSAVAAGSARQVSFTIPAHTNGVVDVVAHALHSERRVPGWDEEGALTVGLRATDSIIVRPSDAVDLSLAISEPLYEVGEEARVTLRTPGLTRGFAAVLVRDEAQHEGERPFSLPWVRERIDRASRPSAQGKDFTLRALLAASIRTPQKIRRVPPLVPPPWYRSEGSASDLQQDPLSMRDARRRQVGGLMLALENAINALPNTNEARTGIVELRSGRARFHPNVIETLVQRGGFPNVRTLGGGKLTAAMLTAVDSDFTFDNVARRVTRRRMVEVLQGLLRFLDPNNATAARQSFGQPSSRWLSLMAEHGYVRREALVDAWGRPFRLERRQRATLAFTVRDPNLTLVSAGPDGRFGGADDFIDPRARILTRGQPYAVSSGEDQLMRQLASVSAAQQTIAGMLSAFNAVSVGARDEQNASSMGANQSGGFGGRARRSRAGGGERGDMARLEAEEMAEAHIGDAFDDDMDGMMNGALGGLAQSQATAAMAPPPPPSVSSSQPVELSVEGAPADPNAPSLASAGERIRQDFPATLAFMPEVALSGESTDITVRLADALTTYHVEVIVWTPGGYTVSERTRIRVDQPIKIDAAMPESAREGDELEIPIRVENRTAEEREVLVELAADGLNLAPTEVTRLRVPSGEAVVTTGSITITGPGEGSLVVRAVNPDRTPLDAAQRPMIVRRDLRRVQRSMLALASPSLAAELPIPPSAELTQPIEVSVVGAWHVFGDLDDGDPLFAGWAALMLGREPSPEAKAAASRQRHSPAAIAVRWADPEISDRQLEGDLRGMRGSNERLLLLTPALERRAERPALSTRLLELRDTLAEQLADRALDADEMAQLGTAATLLLISPSGPLRERGLELLRRASENVVEVGDETFVDAGQGDAQIAGATALFALATSAADRMDDAVAASRFLMRRAVQATSWDPMARGFAAVAVGRAAGTFNGDPSIQLGDVAATPLAGEPYRATFESTPSRTLSVDVGEGAALVVTKAEFGVPWDAAPEQVAPIAIEFGGEIGPRDAHSGLYVDVGNVGPRYMPQPVLEISVPSGAELDETARGHIQRVSAGLATLEEGVLRIPLSPLPVGVVQRVPLPFRWRVAGRLRGLGVSAYDRWLEASDGSVPTAVAQPIVVEVAGEGVPPEIAEARRDEPNRGPSPVPLPEPIEPLRPFANLTRRVAVEVTL